MIREQIKQAAQLLRDVEKLERLLDSGTFLEQIERFGSTPDSNEFRIKGNFFNGSGIDGSVNQRMWRAAQRGVDMMQSEMRREAEAIIKEKMGML